MKSVTLTKECLLQCPYFISTQSLNDPDYCVFTPIKAKYVIRDEEDQWFDIISIDVIHGVVRVHKKYNSFKVKEKDAVKLKIRVYEHCN
jgi:hypothetical protein